MAELWPVPVAPNEREELWLPVNWARVWEKGPAETINTHLFELSSEAVLDGITLMESEHSATATQAKWKAAPGVAGTKYPIYHTVTTTDVNGKNRKRFRTIDLSIENK